MKRLISALALFVIGNVSVASAQEGLRLQTSVGVFVPTLPVVAIANGQDASVELESGSAAIASLEMGFGDMLSVYGSFALIRSRMNHSSALELEGPWRPSSPVNIYTPTGGIILSPRISSLGFRPTLRLGAGVKFYEFNILEVPNGVQDPTGDIGIGITGGQQPVSFTAEARWQPSQFDPAYLPIRLATAPKQTQNEWLFTVGFKFQLGRGAPQQACPPGVPPGMC